MDTQLNDDRREYLDSLVARIDEQARSVSDYVLNNEGYAEPLFYSDWETDRRAFDAYAHRLDADTRDLFSKALARIGIDEIKACCSVERTGIYIQHNEIGSFTIGEVEDRLSDELANEVSKLSQSERAYVCDAVRACFMPETGDYIYVNHSYDRWVLILDPEILSQRLAQV